MHMAYERLALMYAILLPPVAVLVFLAIMMEESEYTFLTRDDVFVRPEVEAGGGVHH
jgi:cytochrome c oxidase subunit IV